MFCKALLTLSFKNKLFFMSTECHSNCYSCTGPSSTDCTSCADPNDVVQPVSGTSSSGDCKTTCDDGFYLDQRLCKGKIAFTILASFLFRLLYAFWQTTFLTRNVTNKKKSIFWSFISTWNEPSVNAAHIVFYHFICNLRKWLC